MQKETARNGKKRGTKGRNERNGKKQEKLEKQTRKKHEEGVRNRNKQE